jgi:hypothetical protein
MSERTYNRVANILMLIGIASALLFDSGIISHIVAGSIGIAAGVAAVTMYFWNQSKTKEETSANIAGKAVEPVKAEAHVEVERMGAAAPEFVASAMENYLVFQAKHWNNPEHVQGSWRHANAISPKFIEADRRRLAAQSFIAHYTKSYARALQWKMPKDASLALMQPEVELSPNEVAECAIHIMQNLALAEDMEIWDYTLGPKGLRVSLRKTHVPSQPAQEVLDFTYMSSPVF